MACRTCGNESYQKIIPPASNVACNCGYRVEHDICKNPACYTRFPNKIMTTDMGKQVWIDCPKCNSYLGYFYL